MYSLLLLTAAFSRKTRPTTVTTVANCEIYTRETYTRRANRNLCSTGSHNQLRYCKETNTCTSTIDDGTCYVSCDKGYEPSRKTPAICVALAETKDCQVTAKI